MFSGSGSLLNPNNRFPLSFSLSLMFLYFCGTMLFGSVSEYNKRNGLYKFSLVSVNISVECRARRGDQRILGLGPCRRRPPKYIQLHSLFNSQNVQKQLTKCIRKIRKKKQQQQQQKLTNRTRFYQLSINLIKCPREKNRILIYFSNVYTIFIPQHAIIFFCFLLKHCLDP